jgi:uncharacterized protein DUF6152
MRMQINQIKAGYAAIVLAALTGSPVLAHHSSAAYDLSKSLTIDATVASVVFTNPHVMLHFDAKTESGEIQHWAIETNNPSVMRRAGWTKETLKAGDKVTITFHPAINGATTGYIRNNDGKIMFNGRQLHFDVNNPGANDY